MKLDLASLGRLALRVVAAITGFVLIFVAYAHLVSMHDARTMLATPRETRFSSKEALARDFSARVWGGFSFDVANDALSIGGHADIAGAAALFLGRDTRLVESRLRARFRFTKGAKITFGVGLASVGDDSHAIAFEVERNGAMCTPRLVGDAHALGPRISGNPQIAEGTPMPCDDAWHTIELRFCPDLMRVLGSIDDLVVLAPFVAWDENTLVRPTFGAQALASGEAPGVEISDVSWRPVPIDLSQTDVDDSFNGKIIDPTWRVVRADPNHVDSTITTGAHGLDVVAHAKDHVANATGVELVTPTTPLGSIEAALDVDVAELSHATIYLGVQNEPGPAWRLADVGLLSLGDGALVPFESGHFDENGQTRFQAFPDHGRGVGKHTLTFTYDAKTRRARSTFDGMPFSDVHVDLPPRSLARFHFGTNVDDGGSVRLAFTRVRVDHFEGK